MTLEDVAEAKSAIEAEGQVASCNRIVERIGGSKRDVVRFMRQLQAEGPVDAVAVEEAALEEEAPAPLSQARDQRDQTAAAERTLGEEEQALKRERQALEAAARQEASHAGRHASEVIDLACRQRLREVRTQLEQVEAERQQVHLKRQQAWQAQLQAADQYSAVQGQAARWLRRLRQAQRAAETSASACHRGAAQEEEAQALEHLAQLIGRPEAEAFAADATRHPAWLKD
jgi:hypothetical protein